MGISRSALLAISILLPATTVSASAQEPGAERQRQLRQLLAQDCSVCHGKSLQGDLGPPLNSRSLAGKSEEKLADTIMEGHEETAMPPWWWMLEEHEARWILRFLRTKQNQN